MTAYMIIAGTITDEDKWSQYRKAVVPLIESFGGRRLNDGKPELLEGKYENGIIAMFEFPSTENIRTFWVSPQYESVKAIRRGAAILNIWAVPGA